MDCVVCGCTQEVEIHGHTQCSKCGRILDGDCCQGSQQSDTKKEIKTPQVDSPTNSPKSI
jgi:hypothetical protein